MKPLEFKKLDIADIEKCYSTLGIMLDDKPCLFFAGEGKGCVRAFTGDDLSICETIWEGGGGTMSIVPLPGGMALASRGFYSMVDSANSTIELIYRKDGAFTHETIAALDFLHRFDTVVGEDGTRYIFAASLHSGKIDKDDWSKPGHMYAGAMPDCFDEPFTVELKQLPGDFYMNHGFCKGIWNGCEAAFTASKEGAFVWLPPKTAQGEWQCEKLLDFPVSDIAIADIDSDGQAEIAALLPFHGDEFKIFRNNGGAYEEAFSYPVENDFYHAVISGKIKGETMFIGGARKKEADLFLVRWDSEAKQFVTQQLDKGQGPSNLALLNAPGRDLLLCANRMVFKASVYAF